MDVFNRLLPAAQFWRSRRTTWSAQLNAWIYRAAHLVLFARARDHRRNAILTDGGNVDLAGGVLEVDEVRRHVRHRVVLVRDVQEVRQLRIGGRHVRTL